MTASSAGGIGRKKNDSLFFSLVVVTERGEELERGRGEREREKEGERKWSISLFFPLAEKSFSQL